MQCRYFCLILQFNYRISLNMKKMMMAVMVAAFLSVISFSSCLNDNGVDYDFMDYMTVVEKNNKVCLVGDEVKFACVDGPEFDGHLVDFDQAMKRQQMYKTEEGRAILRETEGDTHKNGGCGCGGN